ncbi:MAG: DUF2341 domain-containing protein [Euryarchaeota archaeon]|nr:DUF2341 domain-containing protein [Euryarchaeota archaeon]
MEPNQQNKTNGRKTTNDALITLLRVSVIATFGLLLCAGMAAAAFPADWTHSDLITIEEHSGSDLSDYQILVELNVSNFDFSKAQPDGADIRFAELDKTLLSYWIEAWDSTAEDAKVWVKVASVPASSTATIRMYYGNAGATSESNGTAAFILFDDFEDGTVGSSPSGWSCSGNCNNKISSDVAYSGTKSVKMTGSSGGCWESLLHKHIGEPSPYRVTFSLYPPSYSASGCHNSKGCLQLKTSASWTSSGRGFINFERDNNHISACGSTVDYTPDSWHKVEALYKSNTSNVSTTFSVNGDFFTECTSSRYSYEDSLRYLTFGSSDGYNYYDLIYVSKYASPEPTVTVGVSDVNDTIFEDDFDSYATGSFPSSGGWNLKYNGYGTSYQIVDCSQSVSSPNSLKLEGQSNWAAEANHPLSETPDQVVYEVDIKVTQPGSTVMNYHDAEVALGNPNVGTWGTSYAPVRFGRAEDRVIFMSGTTVTMPFNFDQWYHVKTSVDNVNKTYSVWIEGSFLGSGTFSCNGDYTDIRLIGGNNAHTRVWFDNVKVFSAIPGNTTTSHIHIDGKNCVNMPFVARLTDTLGNPIASGTLLYSLGGAQFVKTTDACGYSTFTPTTTGTLIATYNTESITCEIIDDPTLCTGGCNFGTDPQADDLAITSFTTDKTTYARGETMTITIAVENLGGEMYKKLLIDTSSTKSDTGLPLGFVGSWSFVDIGSSTYEMRLYIPTSTDTGTYNVAGGVYADYLADGGSILDIASPVSVTIT